MTRVVRLLKKWPKTQETDLAKQAIKVLTEQREILLRDLADCRLALPYGLRPGSTSFAPHCRPDIEQMN